MRYMVRWLKNPTLALKEAEPAFRNLQINGRPILESGLRYRNFGGMLPRGLAANWLIAAVLDHCTRSNRFKMNVGPEWRRRSNIMRCIAASCGGQSQPGKRRPGRGRHKSVQSP